MVQKDQLENIPLALRNSPHWVVWRLEDTAEKSGKVRARCKMPYIATRPKAMASSTDVLTWSPFPEAVLARIEPTEKYKDEANARGIGYVFAAPYFGVDIDKCVDESGEVADWAEALINQLPATYTEFSPSGKGFHLYYKCEQHDKLPNGHRSERCEAYARARYFTVTGNAVENSLNEITVVPLPEALQIFDLVKNHDKRAEREMAQWIKQKPSLDELMTRTDFPDLSQAVQRLLTLLAYTYAGDAHRMEQEFLRSALYNETHWKEKWTRPSSPLREPELKKAIEYAKAHPQPQKEKEIRLVSMPFTEIKATTWEWLWPDRLPRGIALHMFAAKGIGKTHFWIAVTASASTGTAYPGEATDTKRDPVRVLWLALEDDREKTLKPTLHAAGSDLRNVEILDGKCFVAAEQVSDGIPVVDFTSIAHLKALENLIVEKSFALVIIDPINNYKGAAKHISEDDMRPIHQGLGLIARKTGALIATLNHENKRRDAGSLLMKNSGSGAGTFVARVNYSLCRHSDDESEVVLVNAGSNLPVGPPLLFTFEEHEDFELDEVVHKKIATLQFKRVAPEITAESVLAADQETNKAEKRRIGEWLESFLRAAGPDGLRTDKIKVVMRDENPSWSWDSCRQAFNRLKRSGKADGSPEAVGKPSVWRYVKASENEELKF